MEREKLFYIESWLKSKKRNFVVHPSSIINHLFFPFVTTKVGHQNTWPKIGLKSRILHSQHLYLFEIQYVESPVLCCMFWGCGLRDLQSGVFGRCQRIFTPGLKVGSISISKGQTTRCPFFDKAFDGDISFSRKQ